MTTVEGRDAESTAHMALAAIEQMFVEAMSYIEAVCEGLSGNPAEPSVDSEQDSPAPAVEEYEPTEEITCQAAA